LPFKFHVQTLKSSCFYIEKRLHTSRHVSTSLEEKWILKILKYFSRQTCTKWKWVPIK